MSNFLRWTVIDIVFIDLIVTFLDIHDQDIEVLGRVC